MQFLKIKRTTKLKDLGDIVGDSNVSNIIVANSLRRTPKIGEELHSKCDEAMRTVSKVSTKSKIEILNSLTSDSDVFETAALMGESSWKVFYSMKTFPGMLRIPDPILLPLSSSILGNNQRVSSDIYQGVVSSLVNSPHEVDPEIFNSYNTQRTPKLVDVSSYSSSNLYQWFKIPWGKVSLYSSISDSYVDFPVYPEEISDAVKANYITMPEIVYQYEPWQIYMSSGPRSNSYTFTFHRDMWSGDHRDGKANELVRFCMANCYPEYNGSAVHSSIVNLFVEGKSLIRGVLTDVAVSWDGPIGLDGWYLVCKLTLNITEVSEQPLNYWTMKSKPLIG